MSELTGLWSYSRQLAIVGDSVFDRHGMDFASGISLELQLINIRDVTVPMYWDLLSDQGLTPPQICDYLGSYILPDMVDNLFRDSSPANILEPGSELDIRAPIFEGANPDGTVSHWSVLRGTVETFPEGAIFVRSVVSEELPHGQAYLTTDGELPEPWTPPIITVPEEGLFAFAIGFNQCETVPPGVCPTEYVTTLMVNRVSTYDRDAIVAFLLPQCNSGPGPGPSPGGNKTGIILPEDEREPVTENVTFPPRDTILDYSNYMFNLPRFTR